MVKVINISGNTVEVAGVEIKPHTGHIFETMSDRNRLRLSAMSAVGVVRAYDGDYKTTEVPHQEPQVEVNEIDTVGEIKAPKKQNKKK